MERFSGRGSYEIDNHYGRFYEVIPSGRYEEGGEVLKFETKCRITLRSTMPSGTFAQKQDYIVSIPYEEDVTPKIYVGDKIVVETPNETIEVEVEVTPPASQLDRMAIQCKREKWNLRPDDNG